MKLVVDNTKRKSAKKVFKKSLTTIRVGKTSWRKNTRNEYTKHNVMFSADIIQAVIENRWTFVKKIGPYVVLNVFEPTEKAGRYIEQTRDLLLHLNIHVDYIIDVPSSLDELLTIKHFYEEKRDKEGKALIKELMRYSK